MSGIRLRMTTEQDLDLVVEAERTKSAARFVLPWPRMKHLSVLSDPDFAHLIIERTRDCHPVGFVLVAGLASVHASVELRRIVITDEGKGYGRAALRRVMRLTFGKWRAHRLWLDVMVDNARARHLYESEGFQTEGVLRQCVRTKDGYQSLAVLSICATSTKRKLLGEMELYSSSATNCFPRAFTASRSTQ